MMKVKIFDLEDEKDLEKDINDFISGMTGEIIDIKYQVSIGVFSEEQIFCFSAMIVYTEWGLLWSFFSLSFTFGLNWDIILLCWNSVYYR